MDSLTAAGFAHERAIHGYIDAYNRGDVEGMLVWLHPEVRFANVSGGRTTVATDGIDAFRALAERSARSFASRSKVRRASRSGRGGSGP